MKFKSVENKANPFSLDHYTDEQKAMFKKRDETKKRAEEGYILYSKNGIMTTEKTPDFGTITLSYQGGKFTHLTVTTTKK